MKRTLALLLTLAMLLSYMPSVLFTASADSVIPEDGDISVEITPDDEVEETTEATTEPETSEEETTTEPEITGRVAVCAACGNEVVWQPIAENDQISSYDGTHFYLTGDSTSNSTLAVITVEAGATMCVDLDGHKLTTASEIKVKGTLNIQGEGSVEGKIGNAFGNGSIPDIDMDDLINAGNGNATAYDNALINIASDEAVVNIYGGAYSVTTDKPIVAYTEAGKLNVLGGEIKGTVNAGDLTLGGAAKIDLIETANLTVKADWTGTAVIADAVLGGVAEGDFTGNLTTVDGKKVVNVDGKLAVEAPVVTLTGITVTAPTKVEYELGEELALDGMVVTGTYSDETTASIVEGFTVTGFDSETAGVKTVTVTYGEFTATFKVTVKEAPVVLTGITVTAPTKVEYELGEELALDGMVVTGTYSNETTAVIAEGFTATGFDSATAGVKTITVTFEGFTATFQVTVKAPVNVQITVGAVNTSNSITVTWTAEGADKFQVYQHSLVDGAWTEWTLLTTTASKSYAHKAAVVGTTYEYKIVALSGTTVVGEIVSSSITRKNSPTLTISNAVEGLMVTWEADPTAEAYYIYRNVADDATNTYGELVKVAEVTDAFYLDTDVLCGARYGYVVRALTNGSLSAEGATKTFRRMEAIPVTVSNTPGGVRMTWEAIPGGNATLSYYMYRRAFVNGQWGEWVSLGSTAGTLYSDLKATNGVLYSYKVLARAGSQYGAEVVSNELMRLVPCSVSASNQGRGILVEWSANTAAEAYYLYRSEEVDGSWTEWGAPYQTLDAGTLSYLDSGAENGVKYRYMIVPTASGFVSGRKSGPIQVRLDTPVVTTEIISTGIKINWSENAASSKYFIYRCQLVDGAWTAWEKFITIEKKTTYTHTMSDEGGVWRYMVRVTKDVYESQRTSTDPVRFLKTPKLNPTSTKNGITMTWTRTTFPAYYELYRRTKNEDGTYSEWELIAVTDVGNYTDTTGVVGETYQYTLRAVEGASVSPIRESADVKCAY